MWHPCLVAWFSLRVEVAAYCWAASQVPGWEVSGGGGTAEAVAAWQGSGGGLLGLETHYRRFGRRRGGPRGWRQSRSLGLLPSG